MESLKNALWAFGFAVGLWYFTDQNVSQEEQIAVRIKIEPRSPGIAVTYLDPETQEPRGTPPEVKVTVRAPRSVLLKQGEWKKEARYVPKEDQKLNADLTLPVSKFEFPFPPEVRIKDTSPESITVRLAELVRRPVGIDVDVDETTIPRGFDIERTVTPATVYASGPKENMTPPPRLKTDRIDVLDQLALRNWKPGDLRPPPEVVIEPVQLVPPDPAIVPDRSVNVRVRIVLRAKPGERDFKVKPDLLLPAKESFPFHLEPTTEEVTVTIQGSTNDLDELAKPDVLAKRVRAVVRVSPKDLAELKKKVGTLVPFPVEVWTEAGLRNATDKEIIYNATVREWIPPKPSSPPSEGP